LDIEAADAAIDINNTSTDPLIHFQVSGTTHFTIGTDVTDSKFKIGTTALETGTTALETGTAVTVQPTGEVGIGTTSPTATLDVDGSAIFNESGAAVDFRVEGDTEANLLFVDGSADRIGIGTSAPLRDFHLKKSNAGGQVRMQIENTDNTNASSSSVLSFYTGGSSSGDAFVHFDVTGGNEISLGVDNSDGNKFKISQQYGLGTSDLMTVTQGGNVGVGTTSPTATLDVDGSAIFNESGNSVDFRVEGLGESNLLFVDGSADAVGIGTATPGGKLHVYGDVSEVTASQLLLRVEDKVAANEWTGIGLGGYNANTSKTAIIHERTANYGIGSLHLCVNNTASTADVSKSDAKLTIKSDGNVGIGMTSPSVELDVTGDIEYTGTIVDVSDRRLKENFSSIDSVLTKIMKIEGLSYNMIADSIKTKEYGVVAQDVQKVFPEMVKVVDPENGYLGVSYIQLVPVLLEATKAQQAIIEAQKAENESQKQEIETIKAEASSSSVETNQKLKETAQKLAALEAKLNALLLLNSKGVVLTAEN